MQGGNGQKDHFSEKNVHYLYELVSGLQQSKIQQSNIQQSNIHPPNIQQASIRHLTIQLKVFRPLLLKDVWIDGLEPNVTA